MADARVIKPIEQDQEANEAQIAVHWREEEYYYPSAKFIGQANLFDEVADRLFGVVMVTGDEKNRARLGL